MFRWTGKQLEMVGAQEQSFFLQSGGPHCFLQTGSLSILNPPRVPVNPEIHYAHASSKSFQ